MKFELEEYRRGITDEELIAELKRVASQLGKKSLTREDFAAFGKFGATTYLRRFGTRFNSLERAGLEKTRTPMNISEHDLFKNLEEIWIKLGRQPRYTDIQKPLSIFHVGTYENRFGTWRKALERFVTYVNDESSTSSEVSAQELGPTSPSKQKTKRKINWRLRFVVMRSNNFKCNQCGRSPATDPHIILHVDHIKAWANGGESVLENLQTLCSVCNIGKSDLE